MYAFVLNKDNKTQLNIYVQPGASKTEVTGVYGDRLKIRIKAPPVDGKANEEVISFIAGLFKINKSRVLLLRGETSRTKDLVIDVSYTEVLDLIKTILYT